MRQDIQKHISSAAESVNTEVTEEFLRSRIQSGTEFRRFLDDGGTTGLGWGDLALDEEAASAVEEHEGIEYPLGVQEYKYT